MDWTGDEFGDVGNDGRATTAESSGPCALSGTVTFQFNDWTGLYSLEAQ
jgi:hypothetical protein